MWQLLWVDTIKFWITKKRINRYIYILIVIFPVLFKWSRPISRGNCTSHALPLKATFLRFHCHQHKLKPNTFSLTQPCTKKMLYIDKMSSPITCMLTCHQNFPMWLDHIAPRVTGVGSHTPSYHHPTLPMWLTCAKTSQTVSLPSI